jgi:hypothetical protein
MLRAVSARLIICDTLNGELIATFKPARELYIKHYLTTN